MASISDNAVTKSVKDDDFDEFSEDSIPPDLPSKTEAIHIVRKASAEDPLFRNFLDQWFPVPELAGRPQLNISKHDPSGSARLPINDKLLQLKREIKDRDYDHRVTSASSQQSRYERLVNAAGNNYANYRLKRAQKLRDVFQNMNESTAVSLHEAQEMFNAAHFDVASRQDVNLERIIQHRDAVRFSMLEMLKRDLANLENEFSTPIISVEDTQALEEIVLVAKAEVIRNVDKIRDNMEEIARLKPLNMNAGDEQKELARLAVQWRLLEVLDEMVPDIGETEKRDEFVNPRIVHQPEDINHTLTRLSAKIAHLRSSVQPDLLEEQQNCQLLIADQLRSLQVQISEQKSTEVDEELKNRQVEVHNTSLDGEKIRQSFEEIRKLEAYMGSEDEKSCQNELRKIEAISYELLKDTFTKCCMESPILAQHDLHNIYDVLKLAEKWSEACHDKKIDRSIMLNSQFETILARFKQIKETLARTSKIKEDLRVYHTE